MDKKDLKIIEQLQGNARTPFSKIAREVGLSADSVANRIESLRNKGILGNDFVYINFHKLGYVDYGVYLSTVSLSTQTKKEIIDHISGHRNVHYFSETGGSYNFIIGILAKNPPEFNRILESLIMPFYQYIYSKEIIIRLNIDQYASLLTADEKELLSARFGGSIEDEQLDQQDQIILEHLTKTARAKIITIANELEMSSSSVIQRIKSLKSRGIITGYYQPVNLNSQGYQVYNLTLSLVLTTNEIHSRLKSYCQNNPHTRWLIQTMGDWDFELGIEVKDQKELQKIMDELKEKVHQIAKIDFVTIFSQYKYSCYPF